MEAGGTPAMVETWRSGRVVGHDGIEAMADAIVRAMRLIHRHVGVVAEPSAAFGVEAILEQSEVFQERLVGTIIGGSNLTVERTGRWL